MVKVENLTKLYGKQKAVDNITFTANKGEVLGFLGPNGAGKSTTMKIITCFIPQSEGNVEVCGFDTGENPIEVRRHIGYLPEHNPLYLEMYVKEYLAFVGRLHKVKKLKSRVQELIELTGLELEQRKLIGALSKGYRQRVGIAQAMLHDPDVLILDEPTSGLDPNQLIEIRSLIKQLGQEKTVIFSTHIMQEVQALCDRMLIINRGKIVADDRIEHLQDRVAGNVRITVAFKETIKADQLKKIKGVTAVRALKDNTWQVTTTGKKDLRPELFRFAVDQKLTLLEMFREQYSVEDVFQELTR